jgi:CRP-like cAMP-binding protein
MLKKEDYEAALVSEDSIFNVLTLPERDLLLSSLTWSTFEKGDIIYKEGDKPVALLCLCAGIVKVFKEGVGGREQIIRLRKPISFIGFRALFADANYIASAIAIEECVICSLDKQTLIKLIRVSSELSLSIIKDFALELGQSNQRTVNLTQKHIRGRLAESLLFLVQTYGLEENGMTLKVYLSREDLAALSNMTSSNAIRTLSAFSQEGILILEGRRITIIDFNRLETISVSG